MMMRQRSARAALILPTFPHYGKASESLRTTDRQNFATWRANRCRLNVKNMSPIGEIKDAHL